MDDLEKTALDLKHAIGSLAHQIDMGNVLLDEVIERTQNFREGFYSLKQIRELGRSIMQDHARAVASAYTDEAKVALLREFAQNLGNINSTIMTHINRLDQ